MASITEESSGQADGNTQNSPLVGSLREKGGHVQHPILEVYYFHIRLYVCEAEIPL